MVAAGVLLAAVLAAVNRLLHPICNARGHPVLTHWRRGPAASWGPFILQLPDGAEPSADASLGPVMTPYSFTS